MITHTAANARSAPSSIASPGPGETATYPDLAGKIAVVTGGSKDIGAACARALCDNGVRVAVVGRDSDALSRVAAALTDRGGTAIAVVADCTVERELARLRDTVAESLGPVDILAAYAGGNGMPVPTADETADHWRQSLESDLTSTFLTVSTFLPVMLARHSGVIITMASAAARQAARSAAAYAAAKAGVIALSRHLAGEYAHEGIRVNCIAPSAIETDRMRSWVPDEQRRQLAAAFPLGRLGQPSDIAAATLFLASAASSWITGITLDVAGGKVMP